jgi:hypothetical protein
VISGDAIIQASTTMIVGVIFLVTLREALKLPVRSLFIKDLAYPLGLFSLASILAWLGEEGASPELNVLVHGLSFAVFLAGLVWVLVMVYRMAGEAEEKERPRGKSQQSHDVEAS